MNSGRIAVVGFVILSLLVVRYILLANHPVRASQQTASYAALASQATQEHKLFVVDAMATWCGPCKKMEKDSWSNADVEAWMKENAVFAQVDVDEQREMSEALKIEAMPTVILFKDGAEVRRSVGYLDAAQLLDWLKGV
jgi:thiol-disulfide isomerase/thioredoxin